MNPLDAPGPDHGGGSNLALIQDLPRRGAPKQQRWDVIKFRAVAAVAIVAVAVAGWATFGPGLRGADGPQRNARGNTVVKVGQLGVLKSPEGKPLAQVTLTSVEPRFNCPQPGAPAPVNGQYLALTLEVETTTGYQSTAGFPVNPSKFLILTADGAVDKNTAADQRACLGPDDALPSAIGADGAATVRVVVDTKVKSGTIVFTPGGWEWSF